MRFVRPLSRCIGPFMLVLACQSALATQPDTVPLELVVLGSGGPGATGRAASSYVVLIDGIARILVDAGPGSFVRLGEAKLSLAQMDIVLLTHLHVDHVAELPGLIKARAVSVRRPIKFRVFGPHGRQGKDGNATFPSTRKFMSLLFDERGAFGYLHDFAAPVTLQVRDLSSEVRANAAPEVIIDEGGLSVSAISGHHRDAPTVMYRVSYHGHSITFSGDIDAQGLQNLCRLAKGTDILVFNTVVLDPPGSPEVLYSLHTPPNKIGEIGENCGVHQLLLSHLSPAVESAQREVQTSIAQLYGGPVRFAKDGEHVIP